MLQHWDAQAGHFRDRRRVVRWDRRGMGRSRADEPAESRARHADDLAAILDTEGIERVTVVGHAGGGPSALTFAERFPDRTEALVLDEPPVPAAEGVADVPDASTPLELTGRPTSTSTWSRRIWKAAPRTEARCLSLRSAWGQRSSATSSNTTACSP
jgi:pimeloyl-ACP methyl ester carboxylesterase